MKHKINNLILELNSVCNSNCIYCYLDKEGCSGENSAEFFKLQLRKFAEAGVKNVDFTGGEPTLYKELLGLVRFAKRLGFTKRTLVTNGRRLAYQSYCKQLVDNGINRVVISIDGPNKTVAESITRSPNSFEQTIAAITNIKSSNHCELGMTIVVNKLNYMYAPETIQMCVDTGADFVNLQYILPYIDDEHISCKRLPSSIIPTYEETKEFVAKALDIFGKTVKINVHFIPFCYLCGYESYLLNEASKLDRYALNFKGFGYNIGEHLVKGSVKTKKCYSCGYNSNCIGFFVSYAREFGILKELGHIIK